eukprot:4739299-Amphidinium_carterae.1
MDALNLSMTNCDAYAHEVSQNDRVAQAKGAHDGIIKPRSALQQANIQHGDPKVQVRARMGDMT